ncbi:MAG: lamin tail domain-containing protein, partial [Candidatus Competibacterales bacterium]
PVDPARFEGGVDKPATAAGPTVMGTPGGSLNGLFGGEAEKPRLVIAGAVPNPSGTDAGNEQVTLQNQGDEAISLAGWQLQDTSGKLTWLEGEVPPGKELNVTLPKGGVTLNNSGDGLMLVSPMGEMVDAANYSADQVADGKPVRFVSADATDATDEIDTPDVTGGINPIPRGTQTDKPRTNPDALNPFASRFDGAYDDIVKPDAELKTLFADPNQLQGGIKDGSVRPDDIARARELGVVDALTAETLANQSLDTLREQGVTNLPESINYTAAGPFLVKVKPEALEDFKTALGFGPDDKKVRFPSLNEVADADALEALKANGSVEVVDRFGQKVDTDVVDIDLEYSTYRYETKRNEGPDAKWRDEDNNFLLYAKSSDLNNPDPNTVYHTSQYEMPRFNEGQLVDIHRDDTALATYETDDLGRLVRHSGELHKVEKGEKGTIRDNEYVRDSEEQGAGGMAYANALGLRETHLGYYDEGAIRFNGGHVHKSSDGGPVEQINYTPQYEANNQEKNFRLGDTYINETYHDIERFRDTLLANGDHGGLTLDQLQDMGIQLSDRALAKYGNDETVPFSVESNTQIVYEPNEEHRREIARVMGLSLRDDDGETLGEFQVINYNLGRSDPETEAKYQGLREAGLLDADGAFDNDLDLSNIPAHGIATPNTDGAGFNSEYIPSLSEIEEFYKDNEDSYDKRYT